jgi:[ribosomal protein S5]-alanine N-acetyltransferase
MSLFSEIPILNTGRFLLRPMDLQDAKAVYENLSDKDVVKDMGVNPFKSVKEAEELITFMNDLFEKNAAFRWGIIRISDNKLIGTCGYNGWETNRGSRVEIAYDLGKPYWRKGFMTEILESIIKFTFEEVGFNRIEAFTNLDATPSMNLLMKIGFVQDGVLRGYAAFEDDYIDQRCFSLLKKDWLAKHNMVARE